MSAVRKLFGLGLINYGEALFLLGIRPLAGDAYFEMMDRLEAFSNEYD